MTREEVIERLKKISEYSVYNPDEPLRIMRLDDGLALCEAVEILKGEPSVIDQVLEIIDKKHNEIYNHDFMTDSKTASARLELLEWLQKEVEGLKGGEHEDSN